MVAYDPAAAGDDQPADHLALGVDVAADVVRDLKREEAEPEAEVVGRRRQPVVWSDAPEADVVSSVGVASVVELEGEALHPVADVQRADRGGRVGTTE